MNATPLPKFAAFSPSRRTTRTRQPEQVANPVSRASPKVRPRPPSTVLATQKSPVSRIEISSSQPNNPSNRAQCTTPPANQVTTDTAPGSRSGFFTQQYLILRSQSMVIERICDRIGDSAPEIREVIDAVVNATYSEVFVEAVKQTEAVSLMLQNGKGDLKLLSTLLSVLITISRVNSAVCSSATWDRKRRGSSTVRTLLGDISEPALPEESVESVHQIQEIDSSEENFICRICEEVVPLDLIEEHSALCIKAHEGQFHFHRCGERLKAVKSELARQELLKKKWPGQLEEAVNFIFPVMYFYSLINLAIDVQIADVEAMQELEIISERLSQFDVPHYLQDLVKTFVAGKQLVQNKLQACNEINATARAISRTTRRHRYSTISGFQTTLADFEFIAKLSSGAFARVYLSRKMRTGDLFAIKVIKQSNMALKNQVQTVSTERDIMRKLHSPYVVNFYYSFIEKNNLYLVMEYIPGGDIFSLLQSIGCLEEKDARTYAVQLVKALQFLRENKIIHRDLKPDNVLINEHGRLKLADFGLSYFGVSGQKISSDEATKVIGTPDYMAPEIILGRRHKFAVDYWALGAMIFEMLCGIAPFHGEDEIETFRRIMCGAIRWDEFAEEEVSTEARDLITKLLVFDPDHRLGAKDIREIMDHPWFKGIDWENIDDLEPVFLPNTSRIESYKDYFQDRYNFQDDDEKDIREDIEISRKKFGAFSASMSSTDDEDDIMAAFPAVSLEQLMNSNEEIARRIRTNVRRSSDIPTARRAGSFNGSCDLRPWASQFGDQLIGSPLIESAIPSPVGSSGEVESK